MNGTDSYFMFKLKNREFTFDVDVSNMPCGVNGALYFVEMDEWGDSGQGANTAGARYGTGCKSFTCSYESSTKLTLLSTPPSCLKLTSLFEPTRRLLFADCFKKRLRRAVPSRHQVHQGRGEQLGVDADRRDFGHRALRDLLRRNGYL
jgi:hypothetical protein